MNITQKYDHHININVTYITFILPSPGPEARSKEPESNAYKCMHVCNLKYILIVKIVFFFLKHDGAEL